MQLTKAILQIDLNAIANNWHWFKLNCPNSEIAGVLKADAYGLGMTPIAKRLFDEGCRIFFVAHASEGIQLRNLLGMGVTIYVLNGIFLHEEIAFNENQLIPIANSMQQYQLCQNMEFGLHVDTGMNRLGIRHDEFDKSKFSQPSLIMSHLACASEPSHQLNSTQLDRFNAIANKFPNVSLSLSASAGAMISKDYHFDLIRPGIGLYGGNPLDIGENQMQCVATLNAPIIQTRNVKSGESVGYGASFTAERDTKIAILAIGYADGFIRAVGNNGVAFINNRKCNIIGRVSMDLIAIDVTDIDVNAGDYVEMIGQNITIDEQAQSMGTNSYEVLTRLGNRFERKYL